MTRSIRTRWISCLKSWESGSRTTLRCGNTVFRSEGKGSDPFWDKAEKLLLTSLIAYIHYDAPEEEQNFATLLEFLNVMEVREDDEEYQNPVDIMFEKLGERQPNHFAVRQYRL